MDIRLIVVVAALVGSACVVHPAEPVVYGEAVYYPEYVPANIEVYPRVVYGDGWAYLVDGRWYYSGPHGWVVFRHEPDVLRRRRVYYGHPAPYVQRAPPAHGYPGVQHAPPARRQTAPPAPRR